MRAIPKAIAVERLYLPFATSGERARQLRAEGWCTVQGLASDADPGEEAQRLACGHILRDGQATKLP